VAPLTRKSHLTPRNVQISLCLGFGNEFGHKSTKSKRGLDQYDGSFENTLATWESDLSVKTCSPEMPENATCGYHKTPDPRDMPITTI